MQGKTEQSIRSSLTNAHIIVVDDKPDNLALVRSILNSKSYTNLTLIQDPTTVIETYQRESADLLIIDLNMPVLDGFSLMQALKDLNDPFLPPMLVLTAQTEKEFRQRALDLGARDYISKPFNFSELLARIYNQLEIRQAQILLRDQNILLEEKVKQRTEELEYAYQELKKSRLQVISKLGLAAEYRDKDTGEHIVRMSKISVVIGRKAGMSEKDLELLLAASPMHDIGKIAIPDTILLKPSGFTEEEREVMNTHAVLGAEILDGDDSDLMKMAREIAVSHHEKWDGGGYPYGLKAEAIPLVGRITAIADVFDALTSVRPYKEAWDFDDAVNYINENSGKHFDPMLVDCFMQCRDQIKEITDKFRDVV